MKIIILIFFLFSFSVIPAFSQSDGGITIYKDLSTSKSQWGENIEIKIIVTNSGTNQFSNIELTDEINPIFDITRIDDSFKQQGDKIFLNIENINSDETKVYSYSLESKNGITSQKSMEFIIPKAQISYDVNNEKFVKSSNDQILTLNPLWEDNTIGITLILIVVSFTLGTIGTGIHNLNLKRQDDISDESKGIPHPLLGGVAGALILGMFEGLSVLFSNGQLQPTVQNLVTLVVTCLVAGFAPMEIINRATKQWKSKADAQKEIANAKQSEVDAQKEIANAKQSEAESKEKIAMQSTTLLNQQTDDNDDAEQEIKRLLNMIDRIQKEGVE